MAFFFLVGIYCSKHFPFSILDLLFVIAGVATDSMSNQHWAVCDAMPNNKSKMENGKWESLLFKVI
jgi:hypothetical protein